MIQNDAAILSHFIENWTKELPDYINKLEDKIISRQILPVRKVGADVMIDVVQRYDRTGEGTQIMAKGAVPKGSGVDATDVPHTIYQLLDGFNIHEKDLKLDPKTKTRQLKIILGNMTRKENILSIQGDAAHNLPGIVTAAQANTNGTVNADDKWDRTGTAAPNYYDNILDCLNKMDSEFEARWLVGNRQDLNQLNYLSSDTKEPVWKQIAALFGKTATDPVKSWQVPCGDLTLAKNKVYVCAMDDKAAELVISENPTLRSISQQPGGNYPIELFEWLTMEVHDNQAFVELDVNP